MLTPTPVMTALPPEHLRRVAGANGAANASAASAASKLAPEISIVAGRVSLAGKDMPQVQRAMTHHDLPGYAQGGNVSRSNRSVSTLAMITWHVGAGCGASAYLGSLHCTPGSWSRTS